MSSYEVLIYFSIFSKYIPVIGHKVRPWQIENGHVTPPRGVHDEGTCDLP